MKNVNQHTANTPTRRDIRFAAFMFAPYEGVRARRPFVPADVDKAHAVLVNDDVCSSDGTLGRHDDICRLCLLATRKRRPFNIMMIRIGNKKVTASR